MTFYDVVHDVNLHSSGIENLKALRVCLEIDKSNNLGKVYHIRLTDDADPCFLYSVILKEEDFNDLKAEQRLRVSFDNFPEHLVEILDSCRDATEQVTPGSDEDVRRLLCTKLGKLQTENQQMGRKIDELEQSLDDLRLHDTEKSQKISDLEHRLIEEGHTTREGFNQQLANERDKRETDLKEMDRVHKHQVEELENNIALLNHRNEVYKDKKLELEKHNSILSKKVGDLESNLFKINEDINRLQTRNAALEKDVIDLDGRVISLDQQLDKVERERCLKSKQCSQLQCQLRVADETLMKLTGKLHQTELALNKCSEELKATKHQIAQLQTENAYITTKKTLTVQVVAKLEKDLNEMSAIASDRKEELENKSKELEGAKEKLAELQKIIDFKEKEIKKQINVNAILHKKLGENVNVGNVTAPDAHMVTSMNVSSQAVNKTLPPWINGKSSAQTSTWLDPAYLKPHDGTAATQKSTSAYFPK